MLEVASSSLVLHQIQLQISPSRCLDATFTPSSRFIVLTSADVIDQTAQSCIRCFEVLLHTASVHDKCRRLPLPFELPLMLRARSDRSTFQHQ